MRTTITKTRQYLTAMLGIALAFAAVAEGQCSLDIYEPDDDAVQAAFLGLNTSTDHSICPVADEDWSFFFLDEASAVTLETGGVLGDTRMWLYDSSLTQVDFDDDGGTDYFSRLDFLCGENELSGGLYYVRIDEYGSNDEIDDYSLSLSAAPCSGPAPDIAISPLALNFDQGTPTPIYVELDWMTDTDHDHQPSPGVLDEIVATFRRAGYAIEIDLSNSIAHEDLVDLVGPPYVVGPPSDSPEVQALLAEHFDHMDDDRYFYSLWVHEFSIEGEPSGSSGIADLPGRVHLVSLGSFPDQVGTFSHQVGTFVHEFGHNLNQKHGGADHGHYKPNYLSVMNYHYQLAGIGPSLLALEFADSAEGFNDFGYSNGLMPDLDETALDESVGIGLGRAVDWDCDGNEESSVATDIQASDLCSADAGLSILGDFDNWTDIEGNIRVRLPSAAAGATPCISWEEHAPMAARIRQLERAGALDPVAKRLDKAGGDAFVVSNTGSADLLVTSVSPEVAAPWISWEPQAPFSVAPGESQEVLVFVDFTAAPSGQSTRRLLVTSDDPDESPYPGGVNVLVDATVDCLLSTSATPTVGGSTTGDVVAACGTTVSARAFEGDGYTFEYWAEGESVVSTEADYTFVLDADRNLVAFFSSDEPELIFADGFESGDTSAWPAVSQ